MTKQGGNNLTKESDIVGLEYKTGKTTIKVLRKTDIKRNGKYLYEVECDVCSKDKELFPNPILFTKQIIDLRQASCGCRKKFHWCKEQYLIKVRRVAKEKGFIVHGFAEEFYGAHTKVSCECPIDNHKWLATMHHILKDGSACPRCSGRAAFTEQEALDKCIEICKQENYKPIGFIDGYKNNLSKFEYECVHHGSQKVSYNHFINDGTRCPTCSPCGYSNKKPGRFYLVRWFSEDIQFLKFGITNSELKSRISKQKGLSKLEYKIIFDFYFDNGQIPLDLEKEIKEKLDTSFVNKSVFPDGFTETVSLCSFENIYNILNNYIPPEVVRNAV